MHRDLRLKQCCADGCKNSSQGASSSESAYFLTRKLCSHECESIQTVQTDHLNAYNHRETGPNHTHVHVCTLAQMHCICWAFIHTLSRSPFEYNSLYWHCWRELSKQLSRPLLWLRSVRRALGWREQLKESQSLFSDLSAFWRGVWQRGTALIIRRHSSEKLPDLKLPPNVPSLLVDVCLSKFCCFIKHYDFCGTVSSYSD